MVKRLFVHFQDIIAVVQPKLNHNPPAQIAGGGAVALIDLAVHHVFRFAKAVVRVFSLAKIHTGVSRIIFNMEANSVFAVITGLQIDKIKKLFHGQIPQCPRSGRIKLAVIIAGIVDLKVKRAGPKSVAGGGFGIVKEGSGGDHGSDANGG